MTHTDGKPLRLNPTRRETLLEILLAKIPADTQQAEVINGMIKDLQG